MKCLGVNWGKLGPVGAAVGPAEGGAGQGGTNPCVNGAPGMLHSGTDRQSPPGALSAALQEVPEQLK